MMWKPRWYSYFSLSILYVSLTIESANGLYCYVCSSDTLELCSTLHSLDELPSELCPTDVASCFTKVENGVTIRGCLSNVKEPLCSLETCTQCKANKCNAQIFPEDRLSCLHCEGPSCVNQTNTIDVRYPCVNYAADDECFAIFSYDGSTAFRGCVSDSNSAGLEFCHANAKQCKKCQKRACNSQTLEFEKELACVKCDPKPNTDCIIVAEDTNATECVPTTIGYNNTCYTYQNGSSSVRGCLYEASELIFDECKLELAACITCNQSDCNRVPIEDQPDAIHINDGKITENDIPYEFRSKNKRMFRMCSTTLCNDKNIKPVSGNIDDDLVLTALNFEGDANRSKDRKDKRVCFGCDSRTDSNCLNQLNIEMLGVCPHSDKDLGCYHMKIDSEVVRGCVVNLRGEYRQRCMANDTTCKSCFGMACNKEKHFSECYVTDLDQLDVEPAHETKSSPQICSKYTDMCFVQTLPNGTVIRGCIEEYAAQYNLSLSDFILKNPIESYQICSTPLCNNDEVKPLNCYTCSSGNSRECAEKKNYKLKECPVEVKSTGCYHFDSGAFVSRGCMADLNIEDRVRCEMESNDCKKCLSDRCNNKETFLQCISSNNDIDIARSQICKSYDDKCLIHTTSNGTVQRGCLKELIRFSVNEDWQNAGIFETCDTDRCNNREIESEKCVVCSEIEDIRCEAAPTSDMIKECPLKGEKLGCYLRQERGYVRRGCMSQLDFESQSECRAGKGVCKSCAGDACNKKPSFEICADSYLEISEDKKVKNGRLCPDYMDQCYTHMENGFITRNCTGDDLIAELEDCAADPNHCALCSGSMCNADKIETETCISCDSHIDGRCAGSMLQQSVAITKCPLSLRKGCYHHIDIGHHKRGCVSELYEAPKNFRSQESNEFKICQGANCNSRAEFEKCFVCDSMEDPDCITNPNARHHQVCYSYENQCFTFIGAQNVVRGCINDTTEEIRTKCHKNPHKCAICKTMDEIGCNDEIFEIEKCIECDSDIDVRCQSSPETVEDKICNRVGNPFRKGCYLSIDNDHVERGCVKDLTPKNLNKCMSNTDTCKFCDKNNCNLSKEFQKCYTCNSHDHPKCSEHPKSMDTKICEAYNSTCTTGVDAKGYIHRRCTTNHTHTVEEFANKFETCEGNFCNGEIYPKDILKCYHCNGHADCDFNSAESTKLQPVACSLDSEYNQCFTFMDKDKKMYRGCLGDESTARLMCEKNDPAIGKCVKCSEDGCNNQPKLKKAEISCVKCNDAIDCAYGQVSANASDCIKDVIFGNEESCFTQSLSVTKTVNRDCTLDVNPDPDWCQEENGCNKCSESGCNVKNGKLSWCLRCNDHLKSDCAKIPNLNEFTEQCDNKPYPYSKRGCFTRIKGGNVTRGCIGIDLSDTEYESCRKDETCQICNDNYCNRSEINSSLKTFANIWSSLFMVFIVYMLKSD